jgi:K+-transporting ATPase A subunit
MKANMGSADKVIRILAAIIVGVLYFTGILSGTVSIILLVIAAIFIATSLIGVCPLYLPFGLSTLKKKISGRG